MKTTELTGRALDYAVAMSLGLNIDFPIPDYSTGPAGDSIIDREGVSVIRCDDDYGTDAKGFCNNVRIPVWAATTGQHGTISFTEHQHHDEMFQIYESDVVYGATRREAAMRAYVASKLGDEVEIPKELTCLR